MYLPFLKFANEILAFLVGFRLCLFFEAAAQSDQARLRQLQQYKLRPEYLRDTGLLMNHKNGSPHALYMIYRSLVYPFRI